MSSQKYNRGFIHILLLLLIPIAIVSLYFLLRNKSTYNEIPSPQITQNSIEPSITLIPDEKDEQFPSPDGTKIAYVEETPETIARAKERDEQGYGFVEGSTNVWVMNTDGTNKMQVTKHEEFVYREIIKWMDNDRFLFKDGESFVSLYSVSKNKTISILESTEAKSDCPDACTGLLESHEFSPDKTYYINLFAGEKDDTIEVLELTTLQTFTLHNPHYACMNHFAFTNDHTFTFTSSTKYEALADMVTCDKSKEIEVSVDLEKRKLTVQ